MSLTINAVVAGNLFVITISAGIQQNLVFFVFFWVKHVVAFLELQRFIYRSFYLKAQKIDR